MESHFDPHKCSAEELESLQYKIRQNSIQNGATNCIEWTKSRGKSGYPQMKLGQTFYDRFKNSPYNPAHLLYSIAHKITLDTGGYEMSHLCHNKRCISSEHLSYEPKLVNLGRDQCCRAGVCNSHVYNDWGIDYPKCVLP